MIRRIVAASGLGLLGIDPITAVYILSMGLRREKKSKISVFMISFIVVSIFPAAVLSVIFGTQAAEHIQNIIPEDGSPFWAYLEFAVSLVILGWILKKFVKQDKGKQERKSVAHGSALKYASVGAGFAVAAYTDPTYYAVMILGGETGNFPAAVLMLALWLFISQSPAMAVYAAIQFNCLDRLVNITDKLRNSKIKNLKWVIYTVLVIIALLMLIDSGFYMIRGEYLF